jgi:hypothetical protein
VPAGGFVYRSVCLWVMCPQASVSSGVCRTWSVQQASGLTEGNSFTHLCAPSFQGPQCLLERSKAHPPMKPVIVRTDTSCAGDTETDPVASEQCPPCPLCSAALPTVQAVLSLLGVEVHHGMCGSLCHQGASFLCDSHCCAYLGHLCTAQEQLDPGRSSGVLVPPAHIRGLLWQLSLLT